MKDSVAVLMSTYNGEKYLRLQIDSILSQTEVGVCLVVRDDGSTDSTCQILQEYAKADDRIIIINDGKQLGVGRSFITLLMAAPECDYYSYSDQDDIWHQDKLISGIRMIGQRSSPVLYCCNQNCVNERGEFQYIRFLKDAMESNLVQTVFNNYYAGCTMIMNKALREKIISNNRCPSLDFFAVRIHDAWTACVAYATGEVIFDAVPHMNFRRHDNVYSDEYTPGKKVSKIQTYRRKIQRFKRRGMIKNSVKKTAENILDYYYDYLDDNEIRCLLSIKNYDKNLISKLRLINSDVFKHSIKGTRFTAICKVVMGVF